MQGFERGEVQRVHSREQQPTEKADTTSACLPSAPVLCHSATRVHPPPRDLSIPTPRSSVPPQPPLLSPCMLHARHAHHLLTPFLHPPTPHCSHPSQPPTQQQPPSPVACILHAGHAHRLQPRLGRVQGRNIDQIGQVSSTEAGCAAGNGLQVHVWRKGDVLQGFRQQQVGEGGGCKLGGRASSRLEGEGGECKLGGRGSTAKDVRCKGKGDVLQGLRQQQVGRRVVGKLGGRCGTAKGVRHGEQRGCSAAAGWRRVGASWEKDGAAEQRASGVGGKRDILQVCAVQVQHNGEHQARRQETKARIAEGCVSAALACRRTPHIANNFAADWPWTCTTGAGII